jgi:acetate kinase
MHRHRAAAQSAQPGRHLGLRDHFPGLPQVAVFDTAFHQSMPPHVFLYGLPYEQYDKYHIRKYGFHGTSHEYVARRCADLMKKDFDKIRLITCHMGNGSSITAVKNGKSFDTSMGLTPLEGVVMGTRTGDMDPAVVLYIMDRQKLSPQEMNTLLNNKSGMKGLSGISNDMREIEQKAAEGNQRAKLALDIFVYRVVKYIGSYVAAMGGADAIVFTGGIGENATSMRAKILEPLASLAPRWIRCATDPMPRKSSSRGWGAHRRLGRAHERRADDRPEDEIHRRSPSQRWIIRGPHRKSRPRRQPRRRLAWVGFSGHEIAKQ